MRLAESAPRRLETPLLYGERTMRTVTMVATVLLLHALAVFGTDRPRPASTASCAESD